MRIDALINNAVKESSSGKNLRITHALKSARLAVINSQVHSIALLKGNENAKSVHATVTIFLTVVGRYGVATTRREEPNRKSINVTRRTK